MNDKYNESLKKIYRHFGFQNQKEKLFEEISELTEATMNSIELLNYYEFEEMCDVWVVLTQVLLLNKEEAEKIIEHKIERTLKRMESGYYEK